MMLEKGRGKVVNIASISGLLGQNRRAAYGASKGGIIQLTRSLAVESGLRSMLMLSPRVLSLAQE